MPHPYLIPVWKKAPLLRLLLPFTAGIMLQWYCQFSLAVILVALVSFSGAFFLFFLLPLSLRFTFQPVHGALLYLLLTAVALLITWQNDARQQARWYGRFYETGNQLLVRIDEPLLEKSKSFRAIGCVEAVLKKEKAISCQGKLLLYFSKEDVRDNLQYGDRILVGSKLQPIKNSGNPGGFNYQRYAAFQQLFHQAFLKKKDWIKTTVGSSNRFRQFIFSAREYVLSVLQKRITAGKDERGIAEALLIGYTNDLDKDLVQAYSNTGVVHIIAISGMHLGLIYLLLLWIFTRLPLVKKSAWLQGLLILACLWIFSLLTGAAASVIRSAVMFTFITAGKTVFQKQASIFSSLAASAFVMLCYNPFYLWDVGFQLSYLAVTGIVIFQQPVYHILYIKNKWIDSLWKLAAVSLAAQLLTFPACIYYFHQFPNLFLLTNLIAVPLSAVILYAEIGLLLLSWIPFAAVWVGKLTGALLWLMNTIILQINKLSFSVWDHLPATVASTWLLYGIVIAWAAWLITKNSRLFRYGLISLLVFTSLMTYGKWQVAKQRKIIVYNVPQYQAIDLVSGPGYRFIGDSILQEDGLLQNFHLKPARILLQLTLQQDSLKNAFSLPPFYQFGNKKFAIINHAFAAAATPGNIELDVVILSKNPPVTIAGLTRHFRCRLFVFDASNPAWKIRKWQQECSTLQVKSHSVPDQGAFVMDVGI